MAKKKKQNVQLVGKVIKKGSIVLSYDMGTYFGYFENFSYTEDASKPFNFIFDFSDGSTYNYKFGKLTIGNDMKLSSITRGIYVH